MAESETFDEADNERCRDGSQARYLERQIRDIAAPELREKVVEVRRQMVQFLGAKKAAAALAHRGRTPRGLEELEDLARFMVRHLPHLEVPEAAGQKPDPAGWVKFLQPSLDRVSDLMDQLGDRQEGEYLGVRSKETARSRFDTTYRLVLRICESLYRLTGFDRSMKHLRYRAGRPSEQKPVERRGSA